MKAQPMRTVAPPIIKQATDPGEGIDHYKRLFSFSKSVMNQFIFPVANFVTFEPQRKGK